MGHGFEQTLFQEETPVANEHMETSRHHQSPGKQMRRPHLTPTGTRVLARVWLEKPGRLLWETV